MHSFLETPTIGATVFHSRICDFLITPNSNNTPTPERHTAIRRFFAAVGRWSAEVDS